MSKIKSATRALPERPSLENLKKQAKSLLNAVQSGEAEARVRSAHPRAHRSGNFDRSRFLLGDAQLVIAREYGFPSWPKLKAHLVRGPSGSEPLSVAVARLSPRSKATLVDQLYTRLELVARKVEWVSKPELAGLKHADDLLGLVTAALAHCDATAKAALSRVTEPRELVALLGEALEPIVRQPDPRPMGARAAAVGDHPDSEACVVMLHATRHPHLLGRRYALTEATTRIGRHTTNQILLHSDSVSREHARIERRNAGFVLVDQQSTNGSFVNEAAKATSQHVLEDGDRMAIGDAVLLFLRGPSLDEKCAAAIEYIAAHDALTRTYHEQAWRAETERRILHARGADQVLSALLIDIDQLPELSQRMGRLAGNGILLGVARVLREALGDAAIIGRCLGSQFGVTLPGMTAGSAIELANGLRASVSSRTLSLFGETVAVTVSVGVATLYRTTGIDELVEDARAALERAQGDGRNAVRGPREAAA